MINFIKDATLQKSTFPFGVVEVSFPAEENWDKAAFRALAEQEIARLKAEYPQDSYDRKAVWGENRYYRFFRKFKKTYPVMLQFESVVLKDRPFPDSNPLSEIAFLMEITTFVLSGTHDADCINGDAVLYIADRKEDFEGMRETLHTYPNDFCARDRDGIIFSLIAGTDKRTCAKSGSRNVLYPIFCTPDMPQQEIEDAISTLCRYVKVLCPKAEIHSRII
ncbi:MAG: hypothetical protein J6B21_08925 [Oscillospiraceae bacterium]|nr:hypothetical protein [Oscillospiraceae bacterium]